LSPFGKTKDTCLISNEIIGKDILLIDDIYTKSINIDEDAIQALLDKGAKSVIFYAVAKTKLRNTY
jgi:predicted amidophosphoribosyltransferase